MDSSILMFHDVVNEQVIESGFTTIGARQYRITEENFEKFVTLALKVCSNVIFTFDDGGGSFSEVIAPILEKYNSKGVFFISTNYINTDGFLNEQQIKSLHSHGHIIASHSHTHPRDISKLDYKDIVNEWSRSKEILQNIIGEEINAASIPGGAVSKKVIQALMESGYTNIYTSEPTTKVLHCDSVNIYGRFAITSASTLSHLKKILTDDKFRLSLLRKYKLLRVCKSMLGANYNKLKQIVLRIKKVREEFML